MRRHWLALAVGLVLAAGCLGATEDGEDVEAADATDRPEATTNLTEEELYTYDDTLVGADPPSETGDGPMLNPTSPAAADGFTVPEGAENVTIEGELVGGTGSAKIEIRNGDELSWVSEHYRGVGVPAGGGAYMISGDAEELQAPEPGDYRVSYHVAGAWGITLTVTADTP